MHRKRNNLKNKYHYNSTTHCTSKLVIPARFRTPKNGPQQTLAICMSRAYPPQKLQAPNACSMMLAPCDDFRAHNGLHLSRGSFGRAANTTRRANPISDCYQKQITSRGKVKQKVTQTLMRTTAKYDEGSNSAR